MRALQILLVVWLSAAGAGRFQAQTAGFDVASIKPNVTLGDSTISGSLSGGFPARNATLRALILRAYGLHESQLIGAPAWIAAERFDIEARVETPPPNGPNALLPLVQTLLGERFKLRAHTEMRELPAYVLTFARRDRRLGPQIRPTQADCSGKTQLDRKSVV